jgi:hypothetical protein
MKGWTWLRGLLGGRTPGPRESQEGGEPLADEPTVGHGRGLSGAPMPDPLPGRPVESWRHLPVISRTVVRLPLTHSVAQTRRGLTVRPGAIGRVAPLGHQRDPQGPRGQVLLAARPPRWTLEPPLPDAGHAPPAVGGGRTQGQPMAPLQGATPWNPIGTPEVRGRPAPAERGKNAPSQPPEPTQTARTAGPGSAPPTGPRPLAGDVGPGSLPGPGATPPAAEPLSPLPPRRTLHVARRSSVTDHPPLTRSGSLPVPTPPAGRFAVASPPQVEPRPGEAVQPEAVQPLDKPGDNPAGAPLDPFVPHHGEPEGRAAPAGTGPSSSPVAISARLPAQGEPGRRWIVRVGPPVAATPSADKTRAISPQDQGGEAHPTGPEPGGGDRTSPPPTSPPPISASPTSPPAWREPTATAPDRGPSPPHFRGSEGQGLVELRPREGPTRLPREAAAFPTPPKRSPRSSEPNGPARTSATGDGQPGRSDLHRFPPQGSTVSSGSLAPLVGARGLAGARGLVGARLPLAGPRTPAHPVSGHPAGGGEPAGLGSRLPLAPDRPSPFVPSPDRPSPSALAPDRGDRFPGGASSPSFPAHPLPLARRIPPATPHGPSGGPPWPETLNPGAPVGGNPPGTYPPGFFPPTRPPTAATETWREGAPTLQRLAAGASVGEPTSTPPTSTPPTSTPPASPSSPGPAAPEELARQLYRHLRRELQRELLVDRERAGTLVTLPW